MFIIRCTANVLPMETTDFVCVQNPVLVYLYFFKRPWDYIFHNFRYTFQKLQISSQSVNLKVIKVFQVSNLISVAIESSDRPVNSRESFEWWKIEEKWGNLKSLLFAHSDQFKRLQWAFLGQKLKKIFQNGPNKLKNGDKSGLLTHFNLIFRLFFSVWEGAKKANFWAVHLFS